MRKRKIITFLILLILIPIAVFAQKPKVLNDATYDDRPIHFGFTLGFNSMDFRIQNKAFSARENSENKIITDVINIQPGFHVSMVSSVRINEFFKIRVLPGLSFGERILVFNDLGGNDSTIIPEMKLESSMIEIPILLKYKAKRLNNFTPYVLAGTNFKYDIAAKKDFPEGNDVYVRIKPFDIAYELGFGIDFYLPYFKFTTEIKLSNGMFDILNHEAHPEHPEYVDAIESLKSSMIMISFHFE